MVKPFIYDVELTSTKRHSQFTLPTAYTNDLDVIEFQFNILDDIDLTGATANVILFMKDGSFFQNDETSGVTIEGKTVKYTMKENEGNHSGTSEVQLVVLLDGQHYASPKYKFRIENGLETDVAVEIMIQTWSTLTKEARDYIDEFHDNEAVRQSTFATNEASRQSEFDTNETNRQSTFDTNETNRQDEFDSNEATRQSNEIERQTNETERLANESTRQDNESARQDNESDRQAAETARAEAEDIRSEFYDGFDSRLTATQLQTVRNREETKDLAATVSNVNVNQEAKQTLKTDANIASLPVTAGNGALDAQLKGQTLVNLLPVTIMNSVYGWPLSSGTDSREIIDDYLRVYKTQSTSVGAFTNLTSDGVKYISALFRSPDGVSNVVLGGTNLPTDIPPNAWERASAIYESSGSTIHRFYAGNKTEEYNYYDVKEPMIINLTQLFGAGNEPTKEEMDAMIDGYFDGTKSFTPGRVRATGKNLYPFDEIIRSSHTNDKFKQYAVKLKKGVVYRFTAKDYTNMSKWRYYFRLYKNGEQVEGVFTHTNHILLGASTNGLYANNYGVYQSSSDTSSINFTLQLDDDYDVLIGFTGGDSTEQSRITGIQIEESSTATDYEPYTETVQYVEPVKLNRLPNGVADEITADGDFVQRVKEHTLVESDVTAITPRTNIVDAITRVFDDMADTTNNIDGAVLYEDGAHEITYLDRDDVKQIGNFYTSLGNAKRIVTIFASGITLAEVRADLAGTKIYYQLAEPIVHKNVTTGNLTARPKGTVYFEQYQADAGMYSNGIEISHPDLSIKSLESLSVIDFMTGEEKDLDVSQAVITDRAFTHPELVDGDLAFFIYEFEAPGPNGNKSLEFYDSRYTVTDDVTGKHYKWSIKVSDGVPSITVEEA
ncbi:hypothetical protein SAMN04488102_101370 [Alkalibacterium subtropicum]|uniref:BppU N-terminal domain-containing protein n=1 Tax=Alkalibacterium subtropicum TaxID=753702 RepID=A0A1I1EW75_9LACT|nr:BppU family phage baseplate upper protein [Alkalibacterium subtropicum]SFB90952.1 hypothetical protein SAMN04488102_101370 [Alkalibacterium subtropicum]